LAPHQIAAVLRGFSRDDSITLTGTLLPQFTGGQQNLDQRREMVNEGD
jgi:phage protein U